MADRSERALLAEKKKNTLCIISLSLGSDNPGPMQGEKWEEKKGSIWVATVLWAGQSSQKRLQVTAKLEVNF